MEEKQHPASEGQRQKFRDRGEVARSQDVVRVAVLMGGVATLVALGSFSSRPIIDLMAGLFGDLSRPLDGGVATAALAAFGYAVGPTLVGALALGLAAGLGQTRGSFSTEALAPKFNRLNPGPKLLQLFGSVESLVNVGMSLLKIAAVAAVCIVTLYQKLPPLLGDLRSSVETSLIAGGDVLWTLFWRGAICMLVLAVIDFGVNWQRLEKKMRMSTQEIKDEHKQQAGDPLVKSQRRRRHREMIQQRSVSAVPLADVVLVNPTHYAVALKYVSGQMDAPKVVAKGADRHAQRIRAVARSAGVPVISQPPLTRVLYRQVKIGGEVPADLFQAVALVLAHVYRIRRRSA